MTIAQVARMQELRLELAAVLPPQPVFKRCTMCGREYTAEDWQRLEFLGVQQCRQYGFADQELRNCASCRSTLAVELEGGD